MNMKEIIIKNLKIILSSHKVIEGYATDSEAFQWFSLFKRFDQEVFIEFFSFEAIILQEPQVLRNIFPIWNRLLMRKLVFKQFYFTHGYFVRVIFHKNSIKPSFNSIKKLAEKYRSKFLMLHWMELGLDHWSS
jgi:hypothetical protein